ncbi:DsbA family protein [Aestuariirhabdus sp. Z084]|uniref:DsbA family protein n=1 Tax=Aestuariirhabdus haliotis TaxID=2918751 RepID=UPI00201B40AE|nr:DsbA family protein [Aestuariirhabdus haliotis]MCL6417311.1 DsbA family protein [Aestuariirhabdus haliotis]MCL6421256.1 DsbA family protein [Aestuariirhabdus haliotis]
MQFSYFFDPMCSWCWGFAPIFRQFHEQYADQYPVRMVVGGLRSESEPMSAEQRNYIRGHWQRVNEASGQPFDFENGLPSGFVYDTEPACRAAVVMRSLAPGQLLAFVESIQKAFYQQARDISDSAVLGELARAAGVDEQTFLGLLDSDALRAETRKDFELSASLGVQGFPTLALQLDQQWVAISQGFLPWDALCARVDAALAQAQ